MDNEIMGQFNYTSDRLAANVTFPAHKFPYTTSVYYQCNVKLCALADPECQMVSSIIIIFIHRKKATEYIPIEYVIT